MEWFRWYHGTVSDPKFSVIAKRARQPRYVVIACWPAILEHASTRPDRGELADIDLEEIAVSLELETEQVEAVFTAMIDKGMIVDERLKNWEKRQPKREDATGKERKERWRKKKEGEEQEGTQGNATGRPERARTEQNREEKKREESSSSVEIPTETPPAESEKAMMMTLDHFRSSFFTAAGKHLPGGANDKAVKLCRRFPRDALESAFGRMSEYGGQTIGYLEEILEGKPPRARASPGGGREESIRARNARLMAEFQGEVQPDGGCG